MKKKMVLCFQTMTSADFQKLVPGSSSIRPPHRLIHPSAWVENSRGVAVAPVSVHRSFCLAGQVRVHQGGARGCASARRDHPRGWAISTRNHGELVWSRRSAVVEIWRAASLERCTLALGGAWVWRGKVCVVVGTAQRHAGGDRWGVGEGGGVVHPGAGETALCYGWKARELAVKLTWEWAQVRGTYGDTHKDIPSWLTSPHQLYRISFDVTMWNIIITLTVTVTWLHQRFLGHLYKESSRNNPLTVVNHYLLYLHWNICINKLTKNY